MIMTHCLKLVAGTLALFDVLPLIERTNKVKREKPKCEMKRTSAATC